MKYNYYEYEDAYIKSNIERCKEIALALLPKINREETNLLLEQIKDLEWNWNYPEEEKRRILDIFSKIKIWLMVYNC